MADANQYVFSYEEVVEALLKKQGIHEGLWGAYLEFGIQAANAPGPDGGTLPVAVIPVVKIGLQKAREGMKLPGELDAAVVNPASAKPAKRS